MKKAMSVLLLALVAFSAVAFATTYISKAKAESIAQHAVGGGAVVLAVLETQDNPPVWSVDIFNHKTNKQFEVKVNAVTGHVVQIIPGG
jgi:uncharacterized membrane protein YkoI